MALGFLTAYNNGARGWDVVLDVFIGVGEGMAIIGGLIAVGGAIFTLGSSLFSEIIAKEILKITALGMAGFNLGNFLVYALRGLNPPDPVEMPMPPQPPVHYTPITSMI